MTGEVSLHLLPAGDGDCLLLQASASDGSRTNVLIDGGRSQTYPIWKPVLQRLIGPEGLIDLLVVTHVDADHIGGIISLLTDPDRSVRVGEIWFNGHAHCVAAAAGTNGEAFGVVQGDALTKLIMHLDIPWNRSFNGNGIHSEADRTTVQIGNLDIRVLTPGRAKLSAMAAVWDKAFAEATAPATTSVPPNLESFGAGQLDVARLALTADQEDNARPNGSSIGLMVEAFGRRLILTGDCHPRDLSASLRTSLSEGGHPLKVNLFKVSHHGARTNTTSELLKLVVAKTYAISTDGSKHGHPDGVTLSKIVTCSDHEKTFAFNYRTATTSVWDDASLRTHYRYRTQYPLEGGSGHVRIEL